MLERLKNIWNMIAGKTGRKITLITLAVMVVLASGLSFGMMFSAYYGEATLLNNYMSSLPHIMSERSEALKDAYSSYEEDCKVRGNIGALLYEGSDAVDETQRLTMVRDSVSAQDASLVDANGNILASTRSESSAELSQKDIKTVLASKSGLYDRVRAETDADYGSEADGDGDSAASENASAEEGKDAHAEPDASASGDADETNLLSLLDDPMLYAQSTGDGTFLVVEFDYGEIAKTIEELVLWDNLLARMLSGLNAFAFIVTSEGENAVESISVYPHDGLSQADYEEVVGVAERALSGKAGYLKFDVPGVSGDASYGNEILFGEAVFVAMQPLPDEGMTVFVAVPDDVFWASSSLSATALILFLVCSLILLVIYMKRSLERHEYQATSRKGRFGEAFRKCLPGFIIVALVSACFFLMLQTLEGMSTTASTTESQRESLQYEIDYYDTLQSREVQEDVNRSVTRSNAIARLLSDRPELQTRENLQELARISQAEYLMLYDKHGNERFASNAYTGFSVSSDENDPSHAYEAVLRGYPYVVTDSMQDGITGAYQHTVASLITDAEGLPDGFLVMCVDDADIQKTKERTDIEGVVGSFAAQRNQEALVVNAENGIIGACTDKNKVGRAASEYMDGSIVGENYEGYTLYDWKYSYLSEAEKNGMSVMVVTQFVGDSGMTVVIAEVLLAGMLALLLLYYLLIVLVYSRAEQQPRKAGRKDEQKSSLSIFFHGYIIFLCVFAVVALDKAMTGEWQAFTFVFNGGWSRGLNLFSLWMALFIFAIVISISFVLKALLGFIGQRVSSQAKTLTRLGDSLITYATVIALVVLILSLFGMDTTTVLASAGIVSIAVGMGAKDLIGDILAGLFIIFEGSIHVGDIVQVGGWRGRVTDMGIRTCEITDESNDVMIITNSRISEVVNHSRKKTACAEDFEIPRTVEADKVEALVNSYIESIVKDIPELEGELRMEDIVAITDTSYTVRLAYSCNESERESLTFRLNTAMSLILERESAEHQPEK